MKFQSSTLFVNTGRKPLPGMQKKKKPTKNNIALGVCIAIIAVLCVFVGLIVHVWLSYNEDVAPKENENPTEIRTQAEETVSGTEKKKETDKPSEKPKDKPVSKKTKEEKDEEDKEEEEATSSGSETDITKIADKEFKKVDADYSFGLMNLSDGSTYVKNTEKIKNSAALAPFLAEYASDAIYLGKFDYSTDVSGNAGRDLMTMAFSQGNVEAANLLISHFGADTLNSYFASKGYENTHFGGTIGSEDSYTTSEDLIKLMNKFYNNTTFFPYSDMYNKMRNNTVDDKIMASLPEGAYGANISFTSGEETVDAAVIYTPSGNFIFVAMAEGDNLSPANKAMANSAKKICETLNQ